MYLTEKRSKLIVTIGPSSEKKEVLKQLIENGASTIRVNFSHGDHEEQRRKMELAKEIRSELNIPVSILLDTKGPEIRVGDMKDKGQEMKAGSIVRIHCAQGDFENVLGTSEKFSVSYNMAQDLSVDDTVLLDDGKLLTKVVAVNKEEKYVDVEIKNTHILKTRKRINLPGINFSLPFLAQKDIDDIKFGLSQGITHIAASFVNSAENVRELRKLVNENGGKNVLLISKIESQLGVDNIDEIIEESDGIMVARGDLGLEIPYFDVPFHQQRIIEKCRAKGKIVIVATQMLDSMENSPHPTRAEVTDVYLATLSGADATMLSGESAQGNYPILAVSTMSKINMRAEQEMFSSNVYLKNIHTMEDYTAAHPGEREQIANIINHAAKSGEYKFIVVLSRSGELLKTVSKYRPNSQVIGLIADESLIYSFGLYFGVFISMDSTKLFNIVKQDKSQAYKALEPYQPSKGDKFLVVENDNIVKFTY